MFCLCMCVQYARVYRSQKIALDPLGLDYRQLCASMWALNQGSLEEQPVFLTAELSPALGNRV